MPRWTPLERLKQAERIRALCPWKKSTGPRTEEGKARSSRNAWKGGVRAEAAVYARMLRGFAATTRYMTQTLFSSFRRKRTSPEVNRTRPEHTDKAQIAGVFSSFGRKNDSPVPESPADLLGLDLAWAGLEAKSETPSPAEPDLEDLPLEALLARAQRVLERSARLGIGGCELA